MRSILAGLFILFFAGPLLAQNEVESIGFGGYYRPDCWTPMVVRIKPGTLEPGYYQIQIEQRDLDQDTQVFTRTIQINAENQAKEQRFFVYFLPQTSDGGLPDVMSGASVRDLNAQLKVWLCDPSGRQLQPLPITSTIQSIDSGAVNSQLIGRKFVLCVSDGSARAIYHNNNDPNLTLGLLEDVAMITVRPGDLPENALGYDGVDAVVWLGGSANSLVASGSKQLPALTEFVRLGGKLVVSQPADRANIEALAPLLPIELKDAGGNWLVETRDRNSLQPLLDWAAPLPPDPLRSDRARLLANTNWRRAALPLKVARASSVKPGAVVTDTIDWRAGTPAATQPGKPDTSPYIVRWGVGLGQVTWVAQNLADRSLLQNNPPPGWTGIWDRVLDLNNDPVSRVRTDNRNNDPLVEDYTGGGMTDLGFSLLEGMEHSARGAGLVVLAVGFFVLYWALAGPISYFMLAGKGKKGLSWPIFGASAVVATLLTVLVVRLVMGADAAVKHISFVRWSPDQPAIVESRFGVYLTKSQFVPIALTETDPSFVSYVSAFNPHPAQFRSAGGFVGKERYVTPVGETGDEQRTEIAVPFRSTLKKMQARWSGNTGGIGGAAMLMPGGSFTPRASGKLTNNTGRDLRDVYIAFSVLQPNNRPVDRLYLIDSWTNGQQIDLDKITAPRGYESIRYRGNDSGAEPRTGKVIGDMLAGRGENGWVGFWFQRLRSGADGGAIGSDPNFLYTFPLLSFHERLPFMRKTRLNDSRTDLLRRGARRLDMSACLGAGQLVILAQDAANFNGAKSPLPMSLEVDGSKIAGEGSTFYQFTLPLARTTEPPSDEQVEQ